MSKDGTSNLHGFPSSLQGKTGLPKVTCVSFLQQGAEPQREEHLPYKQEAAEPQAEEGVDFICKETDLQIEEGLSSKQADTSSNVRVSLSYRRQLTPKWQRNIPSKQEKQHEKEVSHE